MEEQWIPIKGYETIYLVSNLGRIKSLDKEVNVRFNCKAIKKSKIIQTNSLRKGYKYVQLYDLESNYKKFSLHRLIALHFIPNPNNYPMINHKDGNTLNNSIDNLEWCTASQNTRHAFDTGLLVTRKGESCTQSKLTEQQVKDIHILKHYGMTSKAISKIYQVSFSTICDIFQGRTWKSVIIEMEGYI